jgi:protein-tyrosine phosphatase
MTDASSQEETVGEVEMTLLRRRNLRDLGGLPARHGLVVTPKRLFRSSSPSLFDAEERRALLSLRPRGVIDLRATAELTQSAGSIFPAEVRVLNVPLFETPRSNWISPSDQRPRAAAERYFEMLTDGLPALVAVVGAVLAPNATPIVVSCTAGRDRTGIVIACILDLLGVTDEAISTDYAHSDRFAQDGGRAHGATMHEFLGLIRGRFGTTERMLATHGLNTRMVEALRQDLLGRHAGPPPSP